MEADNFACLSRVCVERSDQFCDLVDEIRNIPFPGSNNFLSIKLIKIPFRKINSACKLNRFRPEGNVHYDWGYNNKHFHLKLS